MADDPWAQYLAPSSPSSSADPWAQFTKPPSGAAPTASSSAVSPQDLGTTALWNKPANVGWGDYLLAHLAKPFQGADQAAQDYSRTAVDAATFGLGDRLQSALTGNSLADERAQTAAAKSRLGVMAPITEGAMYAMGPGELGAASRIGEAIAPATGKWLGGVLGSAAEGATAGAAGAAGHDESIGRGALIGGALGAAGGVPGGVVGRGGELPTSPTAQSYFDQAEQAYKPLTNIVYDAKNEVHPALDVTDAKNAQRDWSGKRWDDASKTSDEIESLLDKPQLTANDLQQSQIYLRDKVINSPTADPNDKTYAGYYVDRLQHVLENGLPQTGVPQNLPPGVNPSNYAAYVKSQGDFLTGQGRDMQRADVWKAVGGTPAGKDMGAQAGSWLSDQAARAAGNKPGVWAPPGSPYNDAATALAQTTGQPTPLSWYAKHFLLTPLAVTAAGEGINAMSGGEGMGHQPPWARLAEEGAAGLALGGGTAGYKAFTGAANVAEQQAAEAALRQTIASRTMQNPLGAYTPLDAVRPTTPLRDALRTLIYGTRAGS